MRDLLLFLIVCALDGVCILLGSVVGHGIGQRGLFAGAIVGGVLGVALAVWLAARLGLLRRASPAATFAGGVVGFIVAALIAVNNLRGPVVPVASVSLIGIGAVVGKMLSRRQTP